MFPLKVFCISRLIVYLTVPLTVYVIPVIFPDSSFAKFDFPSFLEIWSIYDGNIFIEIAERGYPASGCFGNFPLYPFTMKFLNMFVHNIRLSGLLISNTSFLLALCILYRLVRLEMEQFASMRALWYLALYPFSYFYNSVYSESLFLLFSVLTFFLARERRWFLCGVTGMMAIATRGIGLAIYPAVVYYYFSIYRRRGRLSDILKISTMLLGIGGFMLYLYSVKGNIFYMVTAQSYWGRHPALPHVALIDAWNKMVNFFRNYNFDFLSVKGIILAVINSLYNVNNIVVFVFVLAVSIGLFRNFNWWYGIYVLCSLGFPLCSANLVSLPRYSIVLFPVFMYLGMRGKNKYLHLTVIVLSVGLLILYTVLFVKHIFIT